MHSSPLWNSKYGRRSKKSTSPTPLIIRFDLGWLVIIWFTDLVFQKIEKHAYPFGAVQNKSQSR